jgi:hypothetical protein
MPTPKMQLKKFSQAMHSAVAPSVAQLESNLIEKQ